MISSAPFVWLVGVDLTAHCHGALRFADWLHRRTRALGHRFEALHVVEDPRQSSLYPGSAPLLDRALRLTRACVSAVGARHAIRSIEVARADLAADEIGTRAATGGKGIIVARAGGNEGWSPVSLGSTARHLLRSLPGPLCLVPPDLEIARLDPGPVLVSLETDASSVDALGFAFGIGRQIGRPVIAVHGGVEPDAARSKIEAWCQEHRLPMPGLRLGRVSTTAAIVGDAEDERACMVVCGATRLTLAERPVHESVGTRLAALTSCPVLVIPPRHPVPRRAAFDRIESDVAAEHGPMI